MLKKELINRLARECHITQYQARMFLKAMADSITDGLVSREKVTISGLGTFQNKIRAPKLIMNPTVRGEKIQLPARRVVHFSPGTTIKTKLNQPGFFSRLFGSKSKIEYAKPLSHQQDKALDETKKSIDQLIREIAAESQKEEQRRTEFKKSPTTPPPLPPLPKPPPVKQIKPSPPPPPKPKPVPPPAPRPMTKIPIKKIGSSQASKISYMDLSQKVVPKEILAYIPEYIARLYQAVPVGKTAQGKLIVAMTDPEDYQAIEFIRKKAGIDIEPKIATATDIANILDQYAGLESEIAQVIKGTEFAKPEKEKKILTEEAISTKAPTSRVVASLLKKAVAMRSSDIHFEPEEKKVIVRFRIDGVLQNVLTLPTQIHAALVSRIKILCNMKLDETRIPQDSRFRMNFDGRGIDFRVSTFPTVYGEKVVMRILDKSQGILTLEELGLTGRGFEIIKDAISKSYGMILVTGPTGSGKTTTLYAALDKLNKEGVNIMTLEDPVEYQIPGINQGQVNPKLGFTFAKGLRSIVRQDPDIIMVGEIRDFETAEMSVHSALTGHIVFSTLHTNDAAGAIPRLIDMGVEPFLITSSLSTVVAQRLARRICQECRVVDKIPTQIDREVKAEIQKMPLAERRKIKKFVFYKGRGCGSCNNSGYKGRIGTFEVLPITEKIKTLTLEKVSSSRIKEAAVSEGMIAMKQDGILKAIQGFTTIEEVWRITKE